MSTSLFSSFMDIKKVHQPFIDKRISSNGIQKVKRVLFEPVDHSETQSFLDTELELQLQIQSEKWNFDFKSEKTLNPCGLFVWRPSTPTKPTRPLKRRPSSDLDCDNESLYCLPEHIIRPKAMRPNEGASSPQPKIKTAQALITDFMPVKKSSTELSKKLAPRQSKVPRRGDVTS